MNLKKLLPKNTFINLTGYFYLLVASLFSIPILLHSLGKSLFGVYLLLVAVAPLTSVLDFGINQALIRYLSLPATTDQQKNNLAIFLSLSSFEKPKSLLNPWRTITIQSLNRRVFFFKYLKHAIGNGCFPGFRKTGKPKNESAIDAT